MVRVRWGACGAAGAAARTRRARHRAPQRDTAGVRACSPARGARRRWPACSCGGIVLLLRGRRSRGRRGGRLARPPRARQQALSCRGRYLRLCDGAICGVEQHTYVSCGCRLASGTAARKAAGAIVAARGPRSGQPSAGRAHLATAGPSAPRRARAWYRLQSLQVHGVMVSTADAKASSSAARRHSGRPQKRQMQGSRVKDICGGSALCDTGQIGRPRVLQASGTSSGSDLRRGVPSWQRQSIPEWDQNAKYIILFRFA
ncbi:MAG: hypothetical protein J3K34DRAFT_410399, partial [Monoraphidium minutum]